MKKLLIVDGHSLVNRAFYALPPLKTKTGVFTGGVHGFLRMLDNMIERENPSHLVITFDAKGKNFRHEKFKEYKGNRKGMPDELRMQMPVLKEILEALGIYWTELEGYEADDLMGTLTKQAQDQGIKSVILTGDKDILQLVNEDIMVALPKKGISELVEYGPKEVFDELGLSPDQVIDEMGLRGDPSDNIPGVKGIGAKTAHNLLKGGRHLEDVFEDPGQVTPRIKKLLEEGREDAFLSRDLATIVLEAPISFDEEGSRYEAMDFESARGVLEKYELKSFLKKLQQEEEPKPSYQLEPGPAPLKDELVFWEYEGLKGIKEAGGYYIFEDEVDLSLAKALVGYNLKELYLRDLSLPEKLDDLMISTYLLHPDEGGDIFKLSGIEKTGEDSKTLICRMLDFLETSNNENLKALEARGMIKLYREVEMSLVQVLASIEKEGFRVDLTVLDEEDEKISSSLAQVEGRIFSYVKEPFNINSPKQLGQILFEELSLPVIKKTKTGYSTNREVLDKLQGLHPIIDDILHYRALAKIKGTYIDGLRKVISSDEKIHTSLNQTVAVTGRLSSTEPNLQNIPIRYEEGRRIRKIFVPRDSDHLLLSADYSQIELRVLAHFSEDPVMLEGYEKDSDIHKVTASMVFDTPLEEVTSDQRREAKAVNFGIIYGMSDFGLAENIDIPIEAAKDYIEKYFAKYPKIKAYLDSQVNFAQDQGYVKTLLGRIREIPDIKSSNFHLRNFARRTAMNTPIQGSAADIIKMAMIEVYKEINKRGLKSKMILQVHDELIFDVKKDELEEMKKLVEDKMTGIVKLKVPLRVGMSVGESWYEL
ncbi:MAG: DNA polymerase I [Tissierellia bacterium]|nr:DNA polymerase I [Tissierellia bacterium]